MTTSRSTTGRGKVITNYSMQIMYKTNEGFAKYITCTQYMQQIIMFYQNENVSDVMSTRDNFCAGYENNDSENYNWISNHIPLSSNCQISQTPVENPAPCFWQNDCQQLSFGHPEKHQQQPFPPEYGETNAHMMMTRISEQQTAFGDFPFNLNYFSCTSDFTATQFQPQFQHRPVMRNDHLTAKPYQCINSTPINHRAHIKLVPSSNGNFKAIVKRKRKRTVFTTEQVAALEEVFIKKSYVTREERQVLVNQLQVNDKSIKVWFQNRRLKGKRGTDSGFTNAQTEDRSSPDFARLDYVESQINQKTDKFGYITLDDSVVSDLFNVIDNVLTKSNDLDVVKNDADRDRDSSPIYEPISPASLSDCTNEDENSHEWQPFEPRESLQRLFDLQTMFSISSTT